MEDNSTDLAAINPAEQISGAINNVVNAASAFAGFAAFVSQL